MPKTDDRRSAPKPSVVKCELLPKVDSHVTKRNSSQREAQTSPALTQCLKEPIRSINYRCAHNKTIKTLQNVTLEKAAQELERDGVTILPDIFTPQEIADFRISFENNYRQAMAIEESAQYTPYEYITCFDKESRKLTN